MSIRHEVSELAGNPVDILTDEAAGVRVIVARLGAEMISLARRGADGQWKGFLYRDGDLSKNPGGWNNHATVMGYYIHRLKDEHSFYRGDEIRGGTHSFLRHKMFPAPEVNGSSLVYTMSPDGYDAQDYPLRVESKLTYSLEADGALRVRFWFENQESELSAHVSFGLHPGFAVGSLDVAQVLLPEGRYHRHLAPGNFLSGVTVAIDHPGGPMPFDKAALPDSFLLEPIKVERRVFTLIDLAGGRTVELDCPEAPYLTLWSDGQPYICMEPCWGLPDAASQTPFEQKEGIQEIAPGGTLERGFSISTILVD